MSRTTTLLLFLVVLVLGGAVWWQTRRESRGEFDFAGMLFEGVAPKHVRALRVDNLERSVHLKLERDEAGLWSLTDPIAYPAEQSVVQSLLEMITRAATVVVPEEELAYAEPGFDPPRAVFEVTELLPGGERKTTRVEMGGLDLDGDRVFVRRDGRIHRTLRTLELHLERPVDGYRSTRIFEMSPREVVQVDRSGFDLGQDSSTPLALQVQRRGARWWMARPYRVQASPEAVGAFVSNVATARVYEFRDDAPVDLEPYGLDRPDFELTLEGRRGEVQTALFGSSAGGTWYCKRADLPYVWQIEPTTAFKVKMPADTVFDDQLVRVLRQEVTGVDLVSAERQLQLSRADERWTVRERADEAAEWSEPLFADTKAVEEILSQLEQTVVADYLVEQSVEATFPEDAPGRGLWLTASGERQGGRLGGRYRSEAGSQALFFLRDGENVVSLVPTELEALLAFGVRDLQSMRLFDLDEIRLARLALSHGGTTRAFVRSPASIWKYTDIDAEAVELRPVLDKLFFLRASEHVDGEAPLGDPVTVTITARDQTVSTATIGLGPEGRVEAEVEGRRSVLADPTLHAALVEIVDG